jgi:hypothetical protein
MAAEPQSPAYRIYLLTVWREHNQDESPDPGWRFHLTDPQSGKRYGFTDADGLIMALQQMAHSRLPADEVL